MLQFDSPRGVVGHSQQCDFIKESGTPGAGRESSDSNMGSGGLFPFLHCTFHYFTQKCFERKWVKECWGSRDPGIVVPGSSIEDHFF
jgi:hypothetical protein